MPDPLYLSLWFPSFDLEEMLPRVLAVMQQFPFSLEQPGISYVALHPVSWDEATILEQRFHPGIAIFCMRITPTCSRRSGTFGFWPKMEKLGRCSRHA
jgi:hypothetical protein